MKKKSLIATAVLSCFTLVGGVFAELNFTQVQAAKVITENATGTYDGFDYELWKDNGNTSMTLNDKGTFSCQWSNINNALFRTGKKFDSTKTYSQLGSISVNYDCDYRPSGNSYLCVYGWTKNPLIEYYIVDSWGTWRPPGTQSKGQITVDGGTYDVYESTRVNQPSIEGNTTFKQFWSVRTSKRTSGTISVDKHFKEWERMGMQMGKMYEIALTVEGYQSSGSANVKKHELSIGGSGNVQQPTTKPTTTPTNRPSNPTYNPGTSTNISDMSAFASSYMNKMEKVNQCPSTYIQRKGGVNYPSYTKKSYYSNTTKCNRNVNVLLPPNYDSNKKYPVCYLLHGIFGNEDSMKEHAIETIYPNLLAAGKAKEMIIILPNIYCTSNPNAPQGFDQGTFAAYDNFLNEVEKDLMPWVEKNYSVLTGRDNTAVCGFSMGGRSALHVGYKRPDLFGYVGAFSAAPGVTGMGGLFSDNDFKIKDPKNTPYVTLITVGTNDSVVGTVPTEYHNLLKKNGQDHVYIEVPGADHDTKAIQCGFYNFATSLFGILDPGAFEAPTVKPTQTPTQKPTVKPTQTPTQKPTVKPTVKPTTKPSTGGVDAVITVDNDWGSGAVCSITITNKTGKTLDNWTFECDLNRKIDAVWTGNLVSQSNGHVVISSPEWGATLNNGESYTITFMAGAENGETAISNFTLK